MYFVRCILSCQTVFHGDWLYSFGVVFGCDMDAKVFVVSEFLSAENEDTVFFFANLELLQHRVHSFGSFRKIAMQEVVHIGRHHGNDF